MTVPENGDTKPTVIVLAGIRWDFLRQFQQIVAGLFARNGYKTVFVETTGLTNPRLDRGLIRKALNRFRWGVKKEGRPLEKGLQIYSPLVAPPTLGAFRALNRRVLVPRVVRDLRALAGGGRPVVVAYPPTKTTLDILDGLRPRVLLYDCAENYEGFPGIPEDVGRTERELLGRADLVSCTSRFLLEKVRPVRPDAFQRMPSVDFELFNQAYRPTSPGAPVRKVCYFGTLGSYRFDFDVVEGLAEAGYEVSLIGGAAGERPRVFDHPNVRFTPSVEQEELPALLRPADALIIPYKITGFTRGVFPAKTFECLATGKPVVASPLPDLENLSEHVYMAASAEEYVDALRRIPERETEERVRARLELARRNSREARFRMIEEAIWCKMR